MTTHFQGVIDDIRIYNRAKSDEEIMDLFLENGWTVDVEEESAVVPTEFRLEQNYPNPFNPATTIQFSLSRAERVTIAVYDVLGREIGQILDEVREPGAHTLRYAPKNLASGTYTYRMVAGEFVSTRKFLLMR